MKARFKELNTYKKVLVKSFFITSLFVSMFFISNNNVLAKSMDLDKIKELSRHEVNGETKYDNVYIVGSHIFINLITLEDIMTGARSIPDGEPNFIYRRSNSGVWTNAVKNETISEEDLPESFEVKKLDRLSVIELKSVKASIIADSEANEVNQKAITVSNVENTINVVKNKPLISHENGAGTEGEWYALVINLTALADDLDTEGYTIEKEDKTDVERHGGVLGQELVIWLNAETASKTITFVNKNNTNDKLTLTIKVSNNYTLLSYDAAGEVTEISAGVTYDSTNKNFIIPTGVTEFTFKDAGIAKTVIDGVVSTDLALSDVKASIIADSEANKVNQKAITVSNVENTINVVKNKPLISHENGAGTEGEWYALVINLTALADDLDTEGYTIEKEDKTDVERHGGVLGQELVIWLNAETASKTITFVNKNNTNDKLTLTIKVSNNYTLLSYDAAGEVTEISAGVTYDSTNKNFIIPTGVTEFTFKDAGVAKTVIDGVISE